MSLLKGGIMSCSNFKLNLPADIPWERICVTKDMIDQVVCDTNLPAKWQSSLAVFKYKPDDDFQLFPKYDITYLKVTATITGYQPLDKEIQGKINWHGVNVVSIPGLTNLLNSYNPCHGAILQVVVGPKESNKQVQNYPFFLDFEPKKRELYETATDTREKQSRSIESLNITKSSGATQSLEVLDVDMGSSVGIGMQGSYAGTGGGFNISSSSQGQWGTKRLNAEESMSSRSSDVGQEKRERFSFSTQLSQMYHLLDSYHLGTNRVAFFIQPRPHTLEEPSGFVRGPRPVDGIQEFFMVVAQPKDQKDFCVSLKLDTSHLTKTPIMDYERKTDVSQMASANAPIPTRSDTMGAREKWGEACFIACWDMYYQCYLTHDVDDKVYTAPNGYLIESYTDLVKDQSHGSSSVTVSADKKTLTIHAEANGKICYEDTFGCVDCPDEWQKRSGYARRQVKVNLVSTTPTKKVGEQETLMITTRGLCCCPPKKVSIIPFDDHIVKVIPVPIDLTNIGKTIMDNKKLYEKTQKEPDLTGPRPTPPYDTTPYINPTQLYQKIGQEYQKVSTPEKQPQAFESGKYTIRQANELSNYIKTETIKSLNDPNVKLQKFIDTDFFARQLELSLIQTKKGRELLNASAVAEIPNKALPKLAKHLKKPRKEITRHDLLSLRTEELVKMLKMKKEDVHKMKLVSLGVKLNTGKKSNKDESGCGCNIN